MYKQKLENVFFFLSVDFEGPADSVLLFLSVVSEKNDNGDGNPVCILPFFPPSQPPTTNCVTIYLPMLRR